ncbi:hypothetical protein BDV96DRAFT_583933 [Lophiotrema nucula]|uniref:Autophagy-related protein 6 n=1 Tax=Lophiotrema nucula TaxID=690887 RepID=A0A6A5YUF6_9PLEO|nr:hypothetical protein BDV96DRAFT_583933 [Lophiotrema nucula]
MGWLWGSSSSSATKDELDPSLRDFLANESPTGHREAIPKPPPSKSSSTATKPATPPSPGLAKQSAESAVPPQSAFQDGRYAHLWKNYTPQGVLENRGKSEQDKLHDIVEVYNDRKASIGDKAMENCALEYLAKFDCFKSPSFWQTATLCNAEAKRFNRCFEVQSKFLKALGYLTMEERSAEEDERIQMHADKLYQQMLVQEKAIQEAKAAGREPPKFESVLSKRNIAAVVGGRNGAKDEGKEVEDEEDRVWANVKPAARKEYEEKISKLPVEDQEFERKALLGELRAKQGMTQQVEATFIQERVERMKRREAGQATLGDGIKRLWGWG